MVSADTSATPTSRSYVSDLRQQQAAATRERVVAAAAELFAERGYSGTTMPAIARRAGVSTETVQNHGPKVELLRAAIAAVSFGSAPGAAVAETAPGARLLAASSVEEAARLSAELLATVNAGSHGVWMAFSEAARSDPVLETELRRLTTEISAQNETVLVQLGRARLASHRPAAVRPGPTGRRHRRDRALGSDRPARLPQSRGVRRAGLRTAAGRAHLGADAAAEPVIRRTSPDEFDGRLESEQA